MFEIRAGQGVELITTTEWDANMNNYAGANKAVTTISTSSEFQRMQSDFILLKTSVESLLDREAAEAKMRKEWPALQDVWSQYQMVLTMLENAKKETGKDE